MKGQEPEFGRLEPERRDGEETERRDGTVSSSFRKPSLQ
jgi:hypothetical protein